jgi:hypothetical protein
MVARRADVDVDRVHAVWPWARVHGARRT